MADWGLVNVSLLRYSVDLRLFQETRPCSVPECGFYEYVLLILSKNNLGRHRILCKADCTETSVNEYTRGWQCIYSSLLHLHSHPRSSGYQAKSPRSTSQKPIADYKLDLGVYAGVPDSRVVFIITLG